MADMRQHTTQLRAQLIDGRRRIRTVGVGQERGITQTQTRRLLAAQLICRLWPTSIVVVPALEVGWRAPPETRVGLGRYAAFPNAALIWCYKLLRSHRSPHTRVRAVGHKHQTAHSSRHAP